MKVGGGGEIYVFFGRRVGSCKSLKAFNADPRVGGGQRSGIFMKAPFLARKRINDRNKHLPKNGPLTLKIVFVAL